MSAYDISLTLSEDMVNWPGIDKPQLKKIMTLDEDGFELHRLDLNIHDSTHIDAPRHYLKEGKTVDKIPLERLMGKCKVIDFTDKEEKIKGGDIKDWNTDIILFKTLNSTYYNEKEFNEEYIYLSESACHEIANYGYKTVGVDYFSIANFQDSGPGHNILFENDVQIVETLDLRGIEPGEYEFICLPLKIGGIEGAPARAILRTLD